MPDAPSLLYIVQYTGPFGFIKPWTAVRDGETYSQQFLTPSIIEGMRIKLEASENSIVRHRLRYGGYSQQQETTQSRGIKEAGKGKNKQFSRNASIIIRHVLLEPVLFLAFSNEADAWKASTEHLCLCRNEDLVYPQGTPRLMTQADFDNLDGIELIFTRTDGILGAEDSDRRDDFCVGYNRFASSTPMYGRLEIKGNPVHSGTLPEDW